MKRDGKRASNGGMMKKAVVTIVAILVIFAGYEATRKIVYKQIEEAAVQLLKDNRIDVEVDAVTVNNFLFADSLNGSLVVVQSSEDGRAGKEVRISFQTVGNPIFSDKTYLEIPGTEVAKLLGPAGVLRLFLERLTE